MPQYLLDAGAPQKLMHYRILLPLGSAELTQLDLVTVEPSELNLDIAMVGKQFVIDDRNYGSATVAMAYYANLYDPTRPQ